MPHSMTAFARQESSGTWGRLVWELRSVNHRYLEAGFRMPEGLRSIEPLLREQLKATLARGKVDCTLQLTLDPAAAGLAVDGRMLERLRHVLDELAEQFQASAPVSPMDLLNWPGVLLERSPDPALLADAAGETFAAALDALQQQRAREGGELTKLIRQRVDSIESLAATLSRDLPLLQAAQRQRLLDRLAELQVDTDPHRIEQELVMLAQRSDVAEELDRLQTHLGELRRALAADGPCGRRLDFLVQELNREANTLGSKSGATQTSNTAVEIKVLIEQIREQVQNLE